MTKIKEYPCDNKRQAEDEEMRLIKELNATMNRTYNQNISRRTKILINEGYNEENQVIKQCSGCSCLREISMFINKKGREIKTCYKCRIKGDKERKEKKEIHLFFWYH